jgi:hypothetical protein
MIFLSREIRFTHHEEAMLEVSRGPGKRDHGEKGKESIQQGQRWQMLVAGEEREVRLHYTGPSRLLSSFASRKSYEDLLKSFCLEVMGLD